MKQDFNNSFSVDGGWLTELSRVLWSIDGEPIKAIKLLKSAFPNLQMLSVVGILIGEKKLIGNSNDGIELIEDDSADQTLSIENVINKLENKIDELQDQLEFACGNVTTISLNGIATVVPKRKAGATNLKKIPHQKLDAGTKKSLLLDNKYIELERGGEEIIINKPKKPCFEYSITTDTGWITDDGVFYPCFYQEHSQTVELLGFSEKQVEEKGWIKLQGGKFVYPIWYKDLKEPTQSQIDLIFDWCSENPKGEKPWWWKN